MSFGNWKEVPTPTEENLNKIEIINGVAFCGGNNGVLLKSTDEGESWSAISTAATGNINSILFLNSSVGFFATSNGLIFKTTNGGSSWTSSNLQNGLGGINGIDFKNETIGIAVGDNGNIFRTTDAGASWSNLGSISVYVINDVSFINDTLAVAVGPLGSSLYSTDSGENWTFQSANSTETFSAIEKKDDGTASIVGTNGSYTEFSAVNLKLGSITKIDSEGDWLKDVHINLMPWNYNRVMTVGFSSSIQLDNNGWKTWDLDSANNLNGLHFYNDTIGIACGFNGKIYKTTSGGVPTSRSEIIKEAIALYPNPAENFFTLENIKLNENLTIYNSNGQIIRNELIQSETIDISDLPKGFYYIKASFENHIASGQFIKK